ncbi:MAG: HlyD family secretion protein [Bacteroidetes bacterium]|nr:HlyD family secretion protein [Bacteroidota bacterium]
MDTEQKQIPSSGTGRRIRAYIALSVVILAVLLGAWLWYKQYTAYITTDDAFIDADKVAVSSKMMGRIVQIHANEGDSVKTGFLLVELDNTDLIAQKVQAYAARDQAVSNLRQTEARLELDKKTTVVQEISVSRAREDLDRAELQLKGSVISREQFDHIKKSFESAQAQLDAAHAQLEVGKAQIVSGESSIKSADAQIGNIETMLNNTKIHAPSTGRIAKRWLLPGDVVQPGQAVMTIMKDSLFYVSALFEETKIAGIHNGQKTEFTIDAFPGLHFFGNVIYIGSNTAAQFSLIPPNNASGNFTKITQRVPVKISIGEISGDTGRYPKLRLAAGMSVLVKINKK